MNIMRKELDHTKRIKQMRDKENAEIESKRKQRDMRVQTARVKKYYDEYSLRMKASMLKNKTKEEQVTFYKEYFCIHLFFVHISFRIVLEIDRQL